MRRRTTSKHSLNRGAVAAVVAIVVTTQVACAASDSGPALDGFDDKARSVCDAMYGEPKGTALAAADTTVGEARELAAGLLKKDFDLVFEGYEETSHLALCHLQLEPVEGQAPTGNAILAVADTNESVWINFW